MVHPGRGAAKPAAITENQRSWGPRFTACCNSHDVRCVTRQLRTYPLFHTTTKSPMCAHSCCSHPTLGDILKAGAEEKRTPIDISSQTQLPGVHSTENQHHGYVAQLKLQSEQILSACLTLESFVDWAVGAAPETARRAAQQVVHQPRRGHTQIISSLAEAICP